MDGPADGRRWSRGALAVVALGVALGGGFTANLLQELAALDVAWPPIAVWVFGLTLSGSLASVGGWLAGERFAPGETRRIASWAYLGTGAFVLVVAVTIVIRVAEGRSVAEPQLQLLVGATGGGLAGAVAGHRTVLVRREAADAERTRDTMAFLNRTLRHELLNGVQLVSGHAAVLRERVDDGEALASVDTIEDTAEELGDLIENVRLVADVHAGTADLRPVDVAEVLAEEAAWLDEAYPEATVETDLHGSATARANEALGHAVRNLLTNAVEHNDGDPTVEVSVDVGADRLEAHISDDGPGIPDDEKQAVLQPDEGGTHGFGLHLARTLVEGYDGRLRVEDNDPEGTVFVVELPRPWSPAADGGIPGGGERE